MSLFACIMMMVSVGVLAAMEQPDLLVLKDATEETFSSICNKKVQFPLQDLPSDLQMEVVVRSAHGATPEEAWRNLANMLRVSKKSASFMANEFFRKKVVEKIDKSFGHSIWGVADLAYHMPRLASEFAMLTNESFKKNEISAFLSDVTDLAVLDLKDHRDEYIADFKKDVMFAPLLKPDFFHEKDDNGKSFFYSLALRGTAEMIAAALQDPVLRSRSLSPYVAINDSTPFLTISSEIALLFPKDAARFDKIAKLQLLLESGVDPLQLEHESFQACTTEEKAQLIKASTKYRHKK